MIVSHPVTVMVKSEEIQKPVSSFKTVISNAQKVPYILMYKSKIILKSSRLKIIHLIHG